MATRYRTVGKVVGAETAAQGIVFRIQCLDRTALKLPYACPVNSPVDATADYGMFRMAELVQACGHRFIRDTDQLLDIEFIVTHDDNSVKKVEPIKVPLTPQRKPQSWWSRMAERLYPFDAVSKD